MKYFEQLPENQNLATTRLVIRPLMKVPVLLLILFFVSPLLAIAQHDTVPRSTIDMAPVMVPRLDTTVRYDSIESGQASWYGKQFHGRLTSGGERFHVDSMTAAHKTLPFGTLVRVTNLKNDSVIFVKITDRLPKSSKRCIDLGSGAAKRLGFLRAGVTQVKLERAGTAPLYLPKKKKK